MNEDLEQIWGHIKAELHTAVDETTYRVWLEPLQATDFSERTLTLNTPSRAPDWISGRFGRLLQTAAAAVLGPDVLVDVTPQTPARTRESHAQPSQERGKQARTGRRGPAARQHILNPKFTFDQFVIGDSNRLAHAASLAVAEMPAQAYNPLFICGPPGVGKTHLLQSIGALLLAHNPELRVCSTTGEAFTNKFVSAVAGGEMDDFKNTFRHCDVLLVDDVQFLERKAKTEEEFFHTFNALHDAGSQIVLTSDRPPKDLQALEDRLRERFQAGLVSDIEPPDLTTRMTILRKRAHDDRVELHESGVLELLAARITSNVRALEGALIRVVAFSSLTGRSITIELAEEVLRRLYPHDHSQAANPQPVKVSDIQAATCEQFGISQAELMSNARATRIAWPRQVAMYLARELTDGSLPAIGREFGGRDHTTVLYAWKRAEEKLKSDPTSRLAVDKVRARLSTHSPDRRA